MLNHKTLVDHIFLQDVIEGLSNTPKYLLPKYFYDKQGDFLFQQIMDSPEYYLTRSEREILSTQNQKIVDRCAAYHTCFDMVELGAGDASKTIYLIEAAMGKQCIGHYFPIDISSSMVEYLNQTLPRQIESLQVKGLAGEYFPMLEQMKLESSRPKLVLFLGATIGNMLPAEALSFCKTLRTFLNPGDLLLIGFDLKKHPQTILNAYNDQAGLTRDFNYNLLHRINRELGANFDAKRFQHFPIYDPGTGSCKSYLISTCSQTVVLDNGTSFHFEKDEAIYMEVSQKYTQIEIDQMGLDAGYKTLEAFYDQRRWFVDVLWQVPSNI